MCFSVQVESVLKKLEDQFNARILEDAFEAFILNTKRDPKKYKPIDQNQRIYPKYWSPIVYETSNERVIAPMRYRLIPSWAREEMPSKYNMYNARSDSLESKKTWSNIYTRNHGIIVFKEFYEWVNGEDGKKVVVKFTPKNQENLVAPVLFDKWQSKDNKETIETFAIITTNPYAEVLAAGHDRSPVILKPSNIDEWLSPAETGRDDLRKILDDVEQVEFISSHG